MSKVIKIVVVAAAAALCLGGYAQEKKAKDTKGADAAKTAAQVEKRAMRMVKNAVALFEEKEDERAVGMLEAVERMYPESQARFNASLELGRFSIGKRDFDRALIELKKCIKAESDELRAEALLLQGDLYLAKGQAGEAAMTFRRLTQDFPTSDYANDAFFKIGQIHFEAGRWTRASEAFEMVGTAVPAAATTNEVIFAEAGQRVYIHVYDKDLAVLTAMGQKTNVTLEGSEGDKETAELRPFGKGDGDFIASVKTSPDKTEVGDGVLSIRNTDEIKVTYNDYNTESGEVNKPRTANARTVSSGSVSFLDGAQRQKVRGVFVDQPAFIRLRDLDLDTSDKPDKAKVVVKSLYRERPEPAPGELVAPPPAPDAPWLTRNELELELTETGPRTGVFTGRLVTRLTPADTNKIVKLPAGEMYVNADEKVIAEYTDEKHLRGKEPELKTSEAFVLVGGSTEPQSIVAHSSEATIQAKKLLLEAQLLYKWGSIFKDVGLMDSAKEKSEEGLKRIGELFDLSSRNTLDRSVLEEAYEARWNLYLVKGDLHSAISTCNALVKRYPDTSIADRAFMQIAMARRQEKTPGAVGSAIAVLNAIIGLPVSQLKAEAQYRIGEILEESARKAAAEQSKSGRDAKPDFSSAMKAYQRCAETYPSSAFAGESYKRMVDYYVSIKTFPRALEVIERVFEDYPDAPWLDEMLLKWGVILHRQGDKEGATAKFRQILEEYPGGKASRQAGSFLKRIEE